MQKHQETLIWIIIVAIVLLIMSGMYIQIGVLAKDADTACAGAVLARQAQIQIAGVGGPLAGCETKTEDFTAWSDEDIAETMTRDAAWCYTSFGVGQNVRLLEGKDTYCHVCALYYKDDGGYVKGPYSSIMDAAENGFAARKPGETNTVPDWVERDDSLKDADISFNFDEPVAIVFTQTNNISRVASFMVSGTGRTAVSGGLATGGALAGSKAGEVVGRWGGAAVGSAIGSFFFPGPGTVLGGLAGGFIGGFTGRLAGTVIGGTTGFVASIPANFAIGRMIDEEANLYSGILITPWNEEAVTALGCTRNDI